MDLIRLAFGDRLPAGMDLIRLAFGDRLPAVRDLIRLASGDRLPAGRDLIRLAFGDPPSPKGKVYLVCSVSTLLIKEQTISKLSSIS